MSIQSVTHLIFPPPPMGEQKNTDYRQEIQETLQLPCPSDRDAVNAFQHIHQHLILGKLYLGNYQSFLDNFLGEKTVRILITVCPTREISGKCNNLDLKGAATCFKDQGIEWLHVGRGVFDGPTHWWALVHDCTLLQSPLAQNDAPTYMDELDGYLASIKEKQEIIARIPVQEWFEPVFKQLDKALDQSIPVLVHCQMGVSRSTSLIAAYLISRFSLTVEEALGFLLRKRPCIQSLFREQLKEYERHLKQAKEGF